MKTSRDLADHIRRWRQYPWTNPLWILKLKITGALGKKMTCGCRGYCRGHLVMLAGTRITYSVDLSDSGTDPKESG